MVGGMLCGFSFKDTGHIPINKNLFSLSFVLSTGGLAFFVFAFLYCMIDHKNWWSGFPFNYAGNFKFHKLPKGYIILDYICSSTCAQIFISGMNSIVLYVGHEITRNMFPWSWKAVYGTHGEYLGMNLCGTTIWVVIAVLLYRRKIFLSI